MLGKLSILLALWIYFNTIVNIFGKRFYRYPKDFFITVGQDVSTDQILPIPCIARELKESRFIFKELQKRLAKRLGSWSINETMLAEYFFDPAKKLVEKDKVTSEIEGIVNDLPISKKKKVRHYSSASSSSKELINELIFNKLILGQLNLNEEKKTKQVFQDLKKIWTHFVHYKKGSPAWQLAIEQTRLEHEILVRCSVLDQARESTESRKSVVNTLELSDKSSKSKEFTPTIVDSVNEDSSKVFSSRIPNNLDIKLIHDDKDNSSDSRNSLNINLKLLHNALLAHAYQQHHLDTEIECIAIVSKKKTRKPWWLPIFLSKFLKLNLRSIPSAQGNELGYGMRFRVDNGIIYFSGAATKDFEEQTVVIQISKKLRIIRELWLYGVTSDSEKESLLGNRLL